jgi:RNA polymerase sigma-70 factor (ECF subfamily)
VVLVASGAAPISPPAAAGWPRELDELTLARAQRGDDGACRELFRHHRDAVFSLVWRMLGPRATRTTVEDLVQEAFLRVFRALPAFTTAGPARLSTWILTIATRVTLNDLRARGADRLVLEEDLPSPRPESPGGSVPGADVVERRRLGALIARALARLAPEYRAVFLLREYHELTYEEIAEALSIELGTVRSRLARARAALRAALKGIRDER